MVCTKCPWRKQYLNHSRVVRDELSYSSSFECLCFYHDNASVASVGPAAESKSIQSCGVPAATVGVSAQPNLPSKPRSSDLCLQNPFLYISNDLSLPRPCLFLTSLVASFDFAIFLPYSTLFIGAQDSNTEPEKYLNHRDALIR